MRQALEAMRFSTDDVSLQQRFMREIFLCAADLDFAQAPPSFAQKIHRRLRDITDVKDPYLKVKQSFNSLALKMFSQVEHAVGEANDPFEMAVKFAIAGNIIDSGAKAALSESEVLETLNNTVGMPLLGDIDSFKKAVNNAGNILYLTDNAGEIVFDRLLINFLPKERMVLAVKGCPVINDALIADAEAAGLTKLIRVIENGSDAPGTILEDCSKEFLGYFESADLIISKGQGNYETLSDRTENIFFLLKVKCHPIAEDIGFPTGSHVLLENPRKREKDTRY